MKHKSNDFSSKDYINFVKKKANIVDSNDKNFPTKIKREVEMIEGLKHLKAGVSLLDSLID